MKIFAGELKKVFANRLVIGIFAAALLMNGFILLLNDSILTAYSPAEYKALYSDLGSQASEKTQQELTERAELLEVAEFVDINGLSDDMIGWLKLKYGEKAEEYIKMAQTQSVLKYCGSFKAESALYNDALEQFNSAFGYQKYLDEIQERADVMNGVSIFQKNMSEFAKRNIIKTAEDFDKLHDIPGNVTVAPSKGVKLASDSPFTDIITLLMLLVLCYQLMIREKQDGSLFLMKSNMRGRSAFIASKTAAVICGSAAVSLLLYGENILLARLKYGFGDMGRCIQSVESCVSCGFHMTVKDFFFYYLICKVMIFTFFAVLLLFLSYMIRNTSAMYLILALFDGMSALLYAVIPSNHMLNFFKYINVFYFQQSQLVLCRYQSINIFSQPVRNTWCFSAVFVLIVILSALNIWAFCNCRVSSGGKAIFGFKRKDRKITTNLQGHEFYKLAVTNKSVLILAAFIAFQGFMAASYKEYLSVDDVQYRAFVKQVGGEVTQENQERINALHSRFDELEKEMQALSKQLNTGKITQMEYMAKSLPIAEKLDKRMYLEQVEARYRELLELSEKNGKSYSLIFEKEFNLLTDDERNDTLRSLELLIILIACMGGYFAMENASGMEKIICTCVGGKSRVAKKKIVSSMIVAFMATLITYLPDVLLTQKIHGLNNLNVPLHSLRQFTAISANIKIWQYLLVLFAVRLFGAAIAVLIIHYISDKTKLPLISVVIATAVLALPLLLKLLGITVLDMFSLTPLLSGNMMFKNASFVMALFSIAYAALAGFCLFKLIHRNIRLK